MRSSWTAIALAFGISATAWAQAPQDALIPFVDAHAHLNDEAMQLELMDRYGASHAVVFWGGRSDNESY